MLFVLGKLGRIRLNFSSLAGTYAGRHNVSVYKKEVRDQASGPCL
jgi:hypothetical protein